MVLCETPKNGTSVEKTGELTAVKSLLLLV